MLPNPAFELLRKHKQVSDETEELVLKKIKGQVTSAELLAIFEDGLSGKYGKLYAADAQTLINWVNSFLQRKMNPADYINTPLLAISVSSNEPVNWYREANKCFAAFKKGISETKFHPAVYDVMMLAGKIKLNAYKNFIDGGADADPDDHQQWSRYMDEINSAKQKVLKEVFSALDRYNYSTIFSV